MLAQNLDSLKSELPMINLYGSVEAGWQNYHNVYNFYIFPSYTNTIAFLKKNDIPYDWKDGTGAISSIRIQNDYDYYEKDGFMWDTEDKGEINEALDNIISEELFQMNGSLWTKYNGDMKVKHGLMASFTGENVNGGYETMGSYSFVLFEGKTLPKDLKKACFSDKDDVSVNRGNAGWVDTVNQPLYDIDLPQ